MDNEREKKMRKKRDETEDKDYKNLAAKEKLSSLRKEEVRPRALLPQSFMEIYM